MSGLTLLQLQLPTSPLLQISYLVYFVIIFLVIHIMNVLTLLFVDISLLFLSPLKRDVILVFAIKVNVYLFLYPP